MPAQLKRRKRIQKKKLNGSFRLRHLTIIFSVALVITSFFYVKLASKFWDGKNRLSLVINKNGQVIVAIFDPEVGEIVNIAIPGNTQVTVARQLGIWRLMSVWQLGVNEGLEGKLLAETVTRYLKFPTVAWAAAPAEGFTKANLAQIISATFSTYETNLNFSDRILLALFVLGVKGPDRVDVNLAQTSYLEETHFIDGGEGFVVSGKIPQKILVVFADSQISKEGTRVAIKDATGLALSEKVAEVVEVLGAKVVSINKEPVSNFDCNISGKNEDIVRKVARFFDCAVLDEPFAKSFDLEIAIGEEFARRY